MAPKKDKTEKIEVLFLKAPAHLALAYHKGQKAHLPAELAEELISSKYAVEVVVEVEEDLEAGKD
jgi:hypothetical protein